MNVPPTSMPRIATARAYFPAERLTDSERDVIGAGPLLDTNENAPSANASLHQHGARVVGDNHDLDRWMFLTGSLYVLQFLAPSACIQAQNQDVWLGVANRLNQKTLVRCARDRPDACVQEKSLHSVEPQGVRVDRNRATIAVPSGHTGHTRLLSYIDV